MTWGWGPCAAGTRGTGAPCGGRRAPCSSVTRDPLGGREGRPRGPGPTWPYREVAGGRGPVAGASSEAGRGLLEADADWGGLATVCAGGGPCPDPGPSHRGPRVRGPCRDADPGPRAGADWDDPATVCVADGPCPVQGPRVQVPCQDAGPWASPF